MNNKNIQIAKERISYTRENKLRFLDLSYLQLTHIPDDISDMHYLLDIDLSNNRFSIFPESISNLDNLLKLNISNNELSEFLLIPGKYYALMELDISNNNFNEISESLSSLVHTEITYFNNPFLSELPGEFEDESLHRIKQYLDLINDSTEVNRLYETKLIFVGRGEVGKTTLMKTLKHKEVPSINETEEATQGINIENVQYDLFFPALPPHYNNFNDIENVFLERTLDQWLDFNDGDEDDSEFESLTHISDLFHLYSDEYKAEMRLTNDLTTLDSFVIEKQIQFNLWDFGGQEIYHSTHQFFLTKRSIYLFVWEPRQDTDEEEFDYWLNTIKLLGADSPIIVVMNKSDIRIKNINESDYKNKFKNIVGFYQVSCKTGDGIKFLEEIIKNCVHNLPHIGSKLPNSWSKIKNEIKVIEDNYISYSRFKELCTENNLIISKEEINLLSEYLHDVGDIIHFNDDPILRNIVIINPQWATKAVYALIDTIEIQKANGVFEFSDLENYWNNEFYPIEKHIELIRLMEKFQICFKLIGAKNTYIVPELLRIEILNDDTAIEITNSTPLRFRYQYEFMPKGIVPRLICKLYRLIYLDKYWKNAVIFADDISKALVTENRSKKIIEISVAGEGKFNLMAIIKNELNAIHKDFNMELSSSFHEYIPCNCNLCSSDKNPYYFNFNVLKNFLSQDKQQIDCHKSINSVNIYELISGYNIIKPKHKLIYHVLSASSQLQGQNKILVPSEDARNQFMSNRLLATGLISKDQSRWGISESGKGQGELDIKIEDESGDIITILEGINLTYLDQSKITNHISKVINKYDVNGLFEKFMIVYYDGRNFFSFTKKYYLFLKDFVYEEYIFNDIIDESDEVLQHTELKVYKSIYTRTNRKVVLYHILINLSA